MSQNDKLIQAVQQITKVIEHLLQEKERVYIAIEGRCAAGKSTLAEVLKEAVSCDVAHMDDFFLRPEQRTEERLSKPGENVEHERFLREVLLPYKKGETFSYRPYDCHTQKLKEPVNVEPGRIFLVEGAYSCKETLWAYYDLHIFLDVDAETQLERIKARNGETAAKRFEEIWIPLEETYFLYTQVQEKCDFIFRI